MIAAVTDMTRVKGIGNTTTASDANDAKAARPEADETRQLAATRELRGAMLEAIRVGAEAEVAMMNAGTHAATEAWMEIVTVVRVDPVPGHVRQVVVATAEEETVEIATSTIEAGTTIAAIPESALIRLLRSPRMSEIAVPSLCSSLRPACVPGS